MGVLIEFLVVGFIGLFLLGVVIGLLKIVLPYVLALAVIGLGIYLVIQFYYIIIPVFLLLLVIGLIMEWNTNRRFKYLTIARYGQVPGGEEGLSKGLKNGALKQIDGNYVIFSGFYKKVAERTAKRSNLFGTDLLQTAQQVNWQFPEEYLPVLARYMERKGTLLSCGTIKGENCYITGKAIQSYSDLFHREGAVTEEDFSGICKAHEEISELRGKSRQIARGVLKHLVEVGEADRTELEDLDGALYVTRQSGPSNLKRVEISLD